MTQLNLGFKRHTSVENAEKLQAKHIDILNALYHHKGKENAINSYDLALKIDMVPTNTNQAIRKTCKELLAAGYPVISCRKGFFLATKYSELVEFSENIEARLNGLHRTWRDTRTVITDFAQNDGFNNNKSS